MRAKHAARIRLGIREGKSRGQRVARDHVEAHRSQWHNPEDFFIVPHVGDSEAFIRTAAKAYQHWYPIYAAAAKDRAEKERRTNFERAAARRRREREQIEAQLRDPDLTFHTVYAEGENVRVVTYLCGELHSSILIDPDRAEALAGQYATEAARARTRKGALDAGSRSRSRERQCLESTEQ